MDKKFTPLPSSTGAAKKNLDRFLSGLQDLISGYSKHLRRNIKLLIAGPDGELLKFNLRRKEEPWGKEPWVELGPHNERRLRKTKRFPGRFSLATGESLDGFDGWRLVPDTAENLKAATVHAQAREYREACRFVAPSLRPEYSAMLIPPGNSRRRHTPELEDQVGPYLRKSPAERRDLLSMMKMDAIH